MSISPLFKTSLFSCNFIHNNSSFTSDDFSLSIFDTLKDNTCEKISTKKLAATTISETIIGIFVNLFDKNTKDGEIKETQQHSTGDCWLLSGINALSYTEKGREIIKNALDYQNGYTIVHLEGVGDIPVLDLEVASTKGSSQYSSGDDDMIIFELAIEKVLDGIANGEIILDKENAPWWMLDINDLYATNSSRSSITGGHSLEAIYLITGKAGEKYTGEENMKNILDEFSKNNNENIALTTYMIGDNSTVKDINGQNVQLIGNHGYSIKKVEGNVVTVINPWDSGKEIKLDMQTYLNHFSGIDKFDLSDNNPKQNFIKEISDSVTEIDENNYKTETQKDENGNIIKETIYNSKGKIMCTNVYGANGKIESSIIYDNKGNAKQKNSYEYYENGQFKKIKSHNLKDNTAKINEYSSTGEIVSEADFQYNNDYKPINSKTTYYIHNKKIKNEKSEYNNGNKVSSQQEIYNIETGELISKSENKFNYENNKLKSEEATNYSANGQKINWIYSEYNERNLVTKQEIDEFDSNGKRTKATLKFNDENGNPKSISYWNYTENGIIVEYDDNADGIIDRTETRNK